MSEKIKFSVTLSEDKKGVMIVLENKYIVLTKEEAFRCAITMQHLIPMIQEEETKDE